MGPFMELVIDGNDVDVVLRRKKSTGQTAIVFFLSPSPFTLSFLLNSKPPVQPQNLSL